MVITQQPASINLCGNLPDIKITSATPVDIVLSFKGSVILQEAYRPSADDEIIVKLKDLIDDLLNLEVPAFNVAVFNQASAYADITIDVNNGEEEINFRVVKGGVDSVVLDAEEFLSANFLTWQPQQKFVKYTDPEWLTYYASVESVLKVKAYYQASTQTITLATLPAEQLSAVNINYGNITSLLTDQPLYFDAWVEVAGEVKSFVQRYILTTEAFPAEDIFVFANSIGGLDTIRFTGKKEEKNDYKFDSALFDEDTLDFDIEINQVFSKNSGYFRSERNRVWSLEFFKSLQKYHIRSGAISRVVVTKPKLESVGDELAGYTFDFALSRQTQYLNLSRADELPTDLQIIGPNDELFFLAPRLSEFPQANFDDVLFAVQSPYEGRWYKFSLADILNVFQEQDPTVPDYVKLITPQDIANWNAGGGVVGSVYTKSQIDSFFAGGITITGYNKTDWDTAHSWGNHASAGYATSADVIANFQPLENQRLSTANSVVFNKIEATDTLFIPTTPPTELIPGKAAIYIGDLSGITDVPGSDYVLPIASASILGGIKIGSGLTISGDGTISVSALGGVTSFNTRTGAISLNSGDVTGALGYTPANFDGSNASGTWGINISGNATTATNWGGQTANFGAEAGTIDLAMVFESGVAKYAPASKLQSFLGLGSNAYTSTAYLPLTGGTLSGDLTVQGNGYFSGIATVVDGFISKKDVSTTVLAAYQADGSTRKWQIDKLGDKFALYSDAVAQYNFVMDGSGNFAFGYNNIDQSAKLAVNGNGSFSGTITAPTFIGSLTGNASTATSLATARTINGVSFDGSANITIYDSTKEPSFSKNTAFNKNLGTTLGTVAEGNDSRILNGQTAYGWGNHAGLYPTYSGAGANGTWGINISGNATTATNWGGQTANFGAEAGTIDLAMVFESGVAKYAPASKLQSFLGLGSNAYTSTAYLPLTGGNLSGNIYSTANIYSSGSQGFSSRNDDNVTILSAFNTDGVTRSWQIDKVSGGFNLYQDAISQYNFSLASSGNLSLGYNAVDQGYKLAVNGTGYFSGNLTAPTIKATSVLKIPTSAPPSGALQPGEACMYIGDLSGITT